MGGPSSIYQPRSATVRIGRAADNDIVIADMMVSRHHAEIRNVGPTREIVDLGSQNGIFVDGRRVRAARVNERSIITIGRHTFRLNGHQLEEYIDTGEITFDALNLSFQLPNGKKILDNITFPLEPSSFVAIMGPTGAGKSTLAKALTGFQPATSGQVLYNGRDLYGAYDELRRRIGYVPQDDILHPQLTVARALEFGAELRFPPDVSAGERRQRVAEVMSELGLNEQARTAIENLSGGQRKRTSVALELLTKPSLLFLDEPTSGLDPGYEKSVMGLLRDLSNAGRSVIVITHSVQSLELCDRLLFLARGGFMAYFGPPKEALSYFGASDYPDVFRQLETRPGTELREQFRANPAENAYVRAPLTARPAIPPAAPAPVQLTERGKNPTADLRVLIRRYVAVIAADRRNLRLLVLQAPLIALLVVALAPSGSLTPGARSARGSASTILLALALGAAFMGLSNSIREIVKELPVYRRERAVGLSIGAYLGSKAIVLGVITVVQAVLLVFVGTLRQSKLGPGVAFGPPKLELFLAVALTGLAAMALGLMVSAVVTNADKALTLLPVILLALFLLSGPLFKLGNKPVLREISYLTPTRWGFSALAATSNLRGLGGCSPADCEAAWRHSAGTWTGDMMVLALLTIVPLVLAVVALQRQDPLRHWRRSRGRARGG
jgi:ABC-type multidrug transport system ATPase subunit